MAKKLVSFADRASTAWKKNGSNAFQGTYDIYDTEDCVVNGRVVKKSVVKVVIPMERYQGMKASDFALENIIAAGAVDMLKPTMLHDGNIDSVDNINGTLDQIMDQIDAQSGSEVIKNNEDE